SGVARRNKADIEVRRDGSVSQAHLLIAQHSNQSILDPRREIDEVLEVQRSAICAKQERTWVKTLGPAAGVSGRDPSAAKQRLVELVRCGGGTVERAERSDGDSDLVQSTGDHLATRAFLSMNQCVAAAIRYFVELSQYVRHRRRVRIQIAVRMVVRWAPRVERRGVP